MLTAICQNGDLMIYSQLVKEHAYSCSVSIQFLFESNTGMDVHLFYILQEYLPICRKKKISRWNQ